MLILLFLHLYFVSMFRVGFVYVEDVICTVTFRLFSCSLTAYYSVMCCIDTIWCVGLGGCLKPHVVCWDGQSWCVENGGRIMHIYIYMILYNSDSIKKLTSVSVLP